MNPNLFKIATKELHQDAFITWLLQWADPVYKSSELHLCAQDFVKQLIGKYSNAGILSIDKVVAGRQWENIDVWVEVNDEYLIIIEDKTFSSEHSNQLLTYKSASEAWCKEHNFANLVCIYLKTGSESKRSLDNIKDKGFKLFDRTDFINLLLAYPEIKNNIFIDFREHLIDLDSAYRAFESNVVGDWAKFGYAWPGFYQFIEKEIDGFVNWFWVNNPSRGFWGAILLWSYYKGFPVYVQIEQERLCFKIGFDPEELDTEEDFDANVIQDEWQGVILKGAAERGLSVIKRPSRYVHGGNSRTVAYVESKDWLNNEAQKIDKVKVIEKLEQFIQFQKDVTKQSV